MVASDRNLGSNRGEGASGVKSEEDPRERKGSVSAMAQLHGPKKSPPTSSVVEGLGIGKESRRDGRYVVNPGVVGAAAWRAGRVDLHGGIGSLAACGSWFRCCVCFSSPGGMEYYAVRSREESDGGKDFNKRFCCFFSPRLSKLCPGFWLPKLTCKSCLRGPRP